MEREDDPRARLDLLVGRIDDAIATVFRQIALNRFEHAIHTAPARRGRAAGRADRPSSGRPSRSACSATRSR